MIRTRNAVFVLGAAFAMAAPFSTGRAETVGKPPMILAQGGPQSQQQDDDDRKKRDQQKQKQERKDDGGRPQGGQGGGDQPRRGGGDDRPGGGASGGGEGRRNLGQEPGGGRPQQDGGQEKRRNFGQEPGGGKSPAQDDKGPQRRGFGQGGGAPGQDDKNDGRPRGFGQGPAQQDDKDKDRPRGLGQDQGGGKNPAQQDDKGPQRRGFGQGQGGTPAQDDKDRGRPRGLGQDQGGGKSPAQTDDKTQEPRRGVGQKPVQEDYKRVEPGVQPGGPAGQGKPQLGGPGGPGGPDSPGGVDRNRQGDRDGRPDRFRAGPGGPGDKNGPNDRGGVGDKNGPNDRGGPGDRTGDRNGPGDRGGPGDRNGPGDRGGAGSRAVDRTSPGDGGRTFDASRPSIAPEDVSRRRVERQEFSREKLGDVVKQRRETRGEGGRIIIEEPDHRRIERAEGRIIIRHDESSRFRGRGRDFSEERGPGNARLNIITRPGGIRIVTEVDNDGRLLRRYRRGADGREFVLIDNRDRGDWRHRRGERRGGRDFGFFIDLPAPVVRIPRDRYYVYADRASEEDIEETLSAPPVEDIDPEYSLDEIRNSPRLRERMPSVNLNTITFEFGSWEVADDQVNRLQGMAKAIENILRRNPDEVFLIEGHTDAVGSDEDNLSLSDRRAESVARVLSDEFSIPPENMVTQGYGEQYPLVATDQAERTNRRVEFRRITPLLARGEQSQGSR